MNAIILSALWGVLMMYTGFATKNTRTVSVVASLGVLAVLVVNWMEYLGVSFFNIDTKGMLAYNGFGLIFNTVVLFSTLVYFLLSGREIEKAGKTPSDLYALIFFILSGISIIAGFKSLLMLFIGIEIISIPLYVLAGSDKSNLKSNEAALKYFLMGSFSTGIMLMGIAFLYGDAGTFYLEGINAGLGAITPMKAIGMVLLLASMSFKVSVVPFHFWTPDVYDGAPTVFTSFMATVVKVALFGAFIRLFEDTFSMQFEKWQPWVAVLVVLTLFIGNFTAVFQQSVKRVLAYSSIAQAGFMLLAVYAINGAAKEGFLLYAISYSLATIGIFAVLSRMSDYTFEGFNGMGKKDPITAAALTIFFLSLAGIPLTGGFLAKLFMIKAALSYATWLGIVAVLMAVVSVYYYFKVIQSIYFKEPNESALVAFPRTFSLLLLLIAAMIICLGVYPEVIFGWLYF